MKKNEHRRFHCRIRPSWRIFRMAMLMVLMAMPSSTQFHPLDSISSSPVMVHSIYQVNPTLPTIRDTDIHFRVTQLNSRFSGFPASQSAHNRMPSTMHTPTAAPQIPAQIMASSNGNSRGSATATYVTNNA